MMGEIYILGVGRNTIVTIDLAETCGYKVAGLYHYLDDRTGEDYFGHKIIGCNEELFGQDLTGKNFVVSVGENAIRAEIFQRLRERGANLVTLVHPTAVVSRYSVLKDGVHVYAYAVVDPNVVVEEDSIISSKTSLLHGCRVGKHCFVAPDAVVGANTLMEDYSFVGLNATLVSNKAGQIGRGAVVGASAVVTRPVSDDAVAVGVPAREVSRK